MEFILRNMESLPLPDLETLIACVTLGKSSIDRVSGKLTPHDSFTMEDDVRLPPSQSDPGDFDPLLVPISTISLDCTPKHDDQPSSKRQKQVKKTSKRRSNCGLNKSQLNQSLVTNSNTVDASDKNCNTPRGLSPTKKKHPDNNLHKVTSSFNEKAIGTASGRKKPSLFNNTSVSKSTASKEIRKSKKRRKIALLNADSSFLDDTIDSACNLSSTLLLAEKQTSSLENNVTTASSHLSTVTEEVSISNANSGDEVEQHTVDVASNISSDENTKTSTTKSNSSEDVRRKSHSETPDQPQPSLPVFPTFTTKKNRQTPKQRRKILLSNNDVSFLEETFAEESKNVEETLVENETDVQPSVVEILPVRVETTSHCEETATSFDQETDAPGETKQSNLETLDEVSEEQNSSVVNDSTKDQEENIVEKCDHSSENKQQTHELDSNDETASKVTCLPQPVFAELSTDTESGNVGGLESLQDSSAEASIVDLSDESVVQNSSSESSADVSHLDDSSVNDPTSGEPVRRSNRKRIRKSVGLPARQTPMGLPKPLRLSKDEFTLEEIYTNKNYRTPVTTKSLETIFEYPKEDKDGVVKFVEKRKKKRVMFFTTDPAERPKKMARGVGQKKRVAAWKATRRRRRKSLSDDNAEADQKLINTLNDLDQHLQLHNLSP